MKSILGSGLTAALLLTSVPAALGQGPNPTQAQVERAGDNPIYRVTINVVERNIKAVNYRVRGGETTIDFKGTALLPDSKGNASIESKKGYIEIDAAFEDLKKVSGILLAHPGLNLEIEGHTDSVGGDDFNQSLSERRADSVKSYLLQQGIASSSIKAEGLGETQPVASNDTASGRQQNRRVELIVSGDIIGTTVRTTLR